MNIFIFAKFFAFFINTGSIGCIGLLLIAGFIVLLFFRRRKIQKGVADFYQQHVLYSEQNPPKNVFDALGNKNWQCFSGRVETNSGKTVPFYWWNGYTTSIVMAGNTPQTTISCFLAVSFAPDTVSEDFQQKVRQLADKKNVPISEKLKNFFAVDTKTPILAERLADGSFLIEWRTLDRADIYEKQLNWLRNNLSAVPVMETKNGIEKVSYAEIVKSAPPEDQGMIEILMSILDSMNRDYHDTKAHPAMTFEDHAKYLNLNKDQTNFAKDSLSETQYGRQQLIDSGFNLPEITSETAQAIDVSFPHRKMTYFTAEDIYIDFKEPHRIYIYQK